MIQGYLLVILAVSIWAVSSGVLIKYITVSPLTLFSIGAFFGVVFLFTILLLKKKVGNIVNYPRKTIIFLLLLGAGNAINNSLFFTALKSGSIANAVLAQNLAPVFVTLLFAPVMLKKKITLKALVLVLTGFSGLSILMIPSFQKVLDLALIYGVLSAIFYALDTVIEKRVTQYKIDPLVAVLYKNFVPLLLYMPFGLASVKSGISFTNWLLLAIWGILVLGVSFIFFFRGLTQISATAASILTYGEAIGAIILASIFFKQPINIYVVFGGILIILSGYFIIKERL